MKIVVIDGQGGGFGRALIEKLRAGGCTGEILAVGTNAVATGAMIKAGASAGATGENAVIVNARRADVIAGPLGIVMANSMMGEFSPAMASAVAESTAARVLIPVNRCDTYVAGATELTFGQSLDRAVELLRRLAAEG